MRPFRAGAAVAVAASLVMIGACSGGSDATSPGQTVDISKFAPGPASGWDDAGFKVDPATLKCAGKAPDPTRGITPTSVKVGGLAYLTSPNGSSMTGSDTGAEVRFKAANDAGGVQGRRIDYIGTKDDGQDAARDVQQAQSLVNQDKVFAVVPEMTSYPNFLDTLCQNVVPFFGWGFNDAYCDTAIGFGITGCLLPNPPVIDASTWGLVANSLLGAGDPTNKAVAVVGIDNDSSRAGVDNIARSVKLAGIPVVYAKAPIPIAGLNDATGVVNSIMTSNNGAPPSLIIFPGDFTSTVKITEALKGAGYQGETLNAVGYDPRLGSFQTLDGAHTILQWASNEAQTPGIARMKADFAKYAPGAALSLPTVAGYWAADMFLNALDATGRDLTVDSFLRTLNGGSYKYYVPDTVPESHWPVNHATGTPCAGIVELTNKQYQITSKLSCGSLIPLPGK